MKQSLILSIVLLLQGCLGLSLTGFTMGTGRVNPAVASNGAYVFVAGGAPTASIEVFDISSKTFVPSLSFNKVRSSVIGLSFPSQNTLLFVDQTTGEVERYNATLNTFFQLPFTLSTPLTAASYNNKAVFLTDNGITGRVYNVETSQLDPAGFLLCVNIGCTLAAATDVASASINGKVIFAGGLTSSGQPTRRAVIYTESTNSFSSLASALSLSRSGLSSTVVGNKVYFAGAKVNGLMSADPNTAPYESVVDVYDDSTGQFSAFNLTAPRSAFAFAQSGSEILFAGGVPFNSGQWTNLVEVYDSTTNGFAQQSSLSSNRGDMSAAALGQYAVFIGGSDTNFDFSASSVVDVFSGSSLVQTLTAQPHISAGILEFGSTIYVAGGEQRDSISGSKAFDVIEITCSINNDCSGYTTDYNFITCSNGNCLCKPTFTGSATAADKCRCDSPNTLVWGSDGSPTCLSPGQCVSGRNDLCSGYTENYLFVDCVSGLCACKPGFSGTASASDKCRCDGTLTWDNFGIPSCQ